MIRLLRFLKNYEKTHKDLLIISIAFMVFTVGGSLFWAAIPILSKSYELSAIYIGFIMASIGIIYILSDSILGALADFLGYKKSIILACIFASITALITMTEPDLWLFLIGIVFFSLSWNMLTIASDAYVLYITPKKEAGRYCAVGDTFYNLGEFLATLFIGFVAIWYFFGSGLFFLIAVILALFLFLFLTPEKRKYPKKVRTALDRFLHEGLSIKRAISSIGDLGPVGKATIIDTFVGWFYSSTIWFLIPLSLELFENPIIPSGFAIGVFELPGIIFGVIGGIAADKYSKKKLFSIFAILCGLLTILLAPALTNFMLFMILGFAIATTDVFSSPALDGMLVIVDEKHDKDATAMGNIGVLADFGFVMGPIISGIIYSMYGLPVVFMFLGFLVLAGWITSYYLINKEKRIK